MSQAWVRLSAVPGQPAAAYFTIEGGSREEKLVRVESAVASRVEMHETMTGMHNMSSMTSLPSVTIPARGAVAFTPGGRHLMVYGLDKAIVPGTAVPLRFGFAGGVTAEAEAKTVAAGESAPY